MMTRTLRPAIVRNVIILFHILCLGVLFPTATRAQAQQSAAQYPCPIDADLWLMGGQSNMDGQDQTKKYPAEENPNIVAFDMMNQWMVAKEPITRLFEAKASVHRKLIMQWMSSSTTNSAAAEKLFESFRADLRNNPRGVGPGVAFAQSVYAATGRPIGLIPCSHGGSGMRQWDPALKDQGDESLYGAMMNRVKLVGGGSKIKGLLWYQGESEVGSPEAINNFEKSFLNFIDCLRRDLNQPELPILYVQIGRWVHDDVKLGQGYEQIRELQRRIGKLRKNIYFTTVIDQTLFDPIHVSGFGEQCLGRRLAELALTYVHNKPDHGKQLELESVSVSGAKEAFPVIHLKFSGVSGRLHSASRPAGFELRDAAPVYKAKPLIYRVEFDPQTPAGIDLVVSGPLVGPIKLICGPGIDPYMNVVDDKDMPIPAFGPVEVPIEVTPAR